MRQNDSRSSFIPFLGSWSSRSNTNLNRKSGGYKLKWRSSSILLAEQMRVAYRERQLNGSSLVRITSECRTPPITHAIVEFDRGNGRLWLATLFNEIHIVLRHWDVIDPFHWIPPIMLLCVTVWLRLFLRHVGKSPSVVNVGIFNFLK